MLTVKGVCISSKSFDFLVFFPLERNIVDILSGILKHRSIKLNQIMLKNRASATNDALHLLYKDRMFSVL
jgi:hypothetical protein